MEASEIEAARAFVKLGCRQHYDRIAKIAIGWYLKKEAFDDTDEILKSAIADYEAFQQGLSALRLDT